MTLIMEQESKLMINKEHDAKLRLILHVWPAPVTRHDLKTFQEPRATII